MTAETRFTVTTDKKEWPYQLVRSHTQDATDDEGRPTDGRQEVVALFRDQETARTVAVLLERYEEARRNTEQAPTQGGAP